jgi:hypothetical protein
MILKIIMSKEYYKAIPREEDIALRKLGKKCEELWGGPSNPD